MQDIRLALRLFRKRPGYAVTIVVTLGLALGAITALFSVANATLLASLPFPGGDRIVVVYDKQPALEHASASWPEVVDWRDHARSLEAVAAERAQSMSFRLGSAEPQRVVATLVSEPYFRVFGVSPLVGRGFTAEEHAAGGPPVALLSHAFWKQAFGGDAGVIGKTIGLDGLVYTVVGVLPPVGPDYARGRRHVYIPIEPRLPHTERGEHYLQVYGRLAPGVSEGAARAELDVLGVTLDKENSGHRIGVDSLRETIFGPARPALFVLLCAAAFVLLVAAANITSLMLARLNARTQELGVRAALGASRGRLARQLLTESVILALVGGAVGILLAMWGKDLLLALWPSARSKPETVPLDWRTLGFAAAAAVMVGGLVGMAPALRGSRADVASALRAGVVPRSGLLRSVLVVAQHAIAVVLLVCAALFTQSLIRLVRKSPGFDPRNVVTMMVSLPDQKYPQEARRRALYEGVLERLRALPGVESASAISDLPFGSSVTSGTFEIEGRPDFPSNARPHTAKSIVDADYFRTMRIPVLAGRTFAAEDAHPVLIINQTFADKHFPGESPLGKRIDVWGGFAEVVGVVGDVRQKKLDDPPELQSYLPMRWAGPWISFVARTTDDPVALLGAFKAQVYAVDPDLPVFAVSTLDSLMAEAAAQRRIVASALTGFAGVALLLAALGIYGVLAYSVSQRTREIGVRVALGAQSSSVLALVLGQGMRLAALGTAIGLGLALALAMLLAQFLGGFLYQMSAADPVTYAIMAALLLGVGLVACWLPARRAARIDPMAALRYE